MAVEPKKERVATPVKQQKGWVKWAGRIGKFLMYGGWIVVAFITVGIIILVSVLTK